MTTLPLTANTRRTAGQAGQALQGAGRAGLVYGLGLVFLWIGAMKFTAYEAGAIQGLVASSPLLAWLYGVLDVRGVANLIGVVEIATALLLFARPFAPLAGVVGGLAAAATTFVTLTFLFSAPGWEASLGGFPALSVVPGQFLLKDVVLFAAGLYVAGSALNDLNRG
ncbi:MAG: YkgB family protein [Rhodothalassiaceae bacterium]